MIREMAGFVKKGLGKWQTFCYNKHTCIKACKFVSDKGGIKMAILQDWQKIAYNENASQGELQKFWQRYFLLEKGVYELSLIHISEPTRLRRISYAVFCLKKKSKKKKQNEMTRRE